MLKFSNRNHVIKKQLEQLVKIPAKISLSKLTIDKDVNLYHVRQVIIDTASLLSAGGGRELGGKG
jgi:hypothetical protein